MKGERPPGAPVLSFADFNLFAVRGILDTSRVVDFLTRTGTQPVAKVSERMADKLSENSNGIF